MAAARRGRVPASRVLLVACFGAFLAFLDATIVNVAFPSIRASFPGESIGSLSWVLNAYNIVFAAFLIVCGRLTDLLGRRRAFLGGIALFTVASALLRCRADARPAHRRPGRAGARCGDAGARVARPGRRGLPGTEAVARHRAVGRDRGRGGRARPADRRRPGRAGRLALGVPGQHPVRPRGPAGRPQPAGREPGARPAPDAGPGRRRRCSRSPWPCSTWGSSRAATGAGAAPPWSGRSPPPLSWWSCSASARGGTARRCSTRRCCASPRSRSPRRATVVAGLGFYAYLLTNILWLQYVWGYGVLRAGLALVPGALVAAVVAARLGPLADRYGYRPFVVPGALVWAGAYLWYHQQVGLVPAFWARVAAGSGAQRHRRRRHPPAAGQRGPRCRPRRPLRHRLGRGVQRPPGRRRPGHRPARRHPGRPDPGDCRRGLPRRLGAVDRGLPGRGAGRAAAGPAAPGARRGGGDRGCRRPSCACPTRHRPLSRH